MLKACCYVPGYPKVWLHRFYQANHSIILLTIPRKAQPQYIITVPIIITINTKKFFKCSIIVSSKLFSLIRSPESSVAQSPLGEPFHYFANYPYNCPAEICQHCPNCYNNQPKRLLKRVHIQWIHFRFLQIVFSCTAQLIFVPRKFSAHRNHVLCVKFAHIKNSSIYFSASSYHNVIIPSAVFRHAKSRRADCRRISCRNIFISRSVMPRSGQRWGSLCRCTQIGVERWLSFSSREYAIQAAIYFCLTPAFSG